MTGTPRRACLARAQASGDASPAGGAEVAGVPGVGSGADLGPDSFTVAPQPATMAQAAADAATLWRQGATADAVRCGGAFKRGWVPGTLAI